MTDAAISNKNFKRLGHINDKLYKVDLAKFEIAHKEPIIVGFIILQYAKLRMLELYYALNCCVCVARHTVVLTTYATSVNSAARG